MNRFHKWILAEKDPEKIIQRSTVWNLITSGLNSCATALIILCISWMGVQEQAGIFSLATAVAYQIQAIGFFGVRNYHIQDVKNKYSFSEYVTVNVLSSVVMVAVLVFMTFGRGYSLEKALIVLFYSLYRAMEIYEALYHDEYQRKGRIDIGLILQTVRFLITLSILVITMLITKNMVLACLLAVLMSIVIIWFQNKDFYKLFDCRLRKPSKKKVKTLLLICLPICITGFISMYLTNASKYAIDSYLGDTTQGVFAVLFVPVFTINMLSMVIYRPYITQISIEWHNGEVYNFLKSVGKQMLVIMALTVAITIFGYVIGLKLLGLLYHMDLLAWKWDFIVLLLGGGMNTFAVFLQQILVIVGCQNLTLLIYLFSMVATWLLSQPLVVSQGLRGASLLYLISTVVLAVGSFAVLSWRVKRK